jgi:alanine racemase
MTTTTSASSARSLARVPWRFTRVQPAQTMSFELPRRRALDQVVRPTRTEISVAALRHNLQAVRALAKPAEVLAVVKANAYGHGAVQVARVLEDEGVSMLGVALIEEGLELRNAGVKTPVLVMGGSYHGGYQLMVEHGLTPTLFREEHITGLVEAAHRTGKPATAHLKLDTGMSRLGVAPGELARFLELLRGARGAIEVEGFLSHFSSADVEDSQLTVLQLQRFKQGLAQVRDAGFNPKWRHLSNSAGLLALREAQDGLDVNLARPGLVLYGIAPEPWLAKNVKLERVMSWKTGVIHLHTVEAGTAVSYGATWTAQRKSLIATLPVGYADGYSRVYSGKSQVLIRGQRAPVVGRVTMDMCMVDVTDVPGVAMHDEVVLLGAQGAERVDAEELGRFADTLHYEILCSVGARVPRLLV